MKRKKDVAIFEKIPVYLSEREISADFNVKSFNTYNPIIIPILMNRVKYVSKKLYKKSVKAAINQKGDAVLIVDDAHFKVLKMK